MEMKYRLAAPEDQAFLLAMLMYASHEPSVASVLQQPALMIYVQDWGRTGDLGYIAELNGQGIGAAWLRLWSDTERGFAYIDNETPELAMAMLPEYCDQGIGTALLTQLLRDVESCYPGVALSVRSGNPAYRLYGRMGFIQVPGSEVVNRTGGTSVTLRRGFIQTD